MFWQYLIGLRNAYSSPYEVGKTEIDESIFKIHKQEWRYKYDMNILRYEKCMKFVL